MLLRYLREGRAPYGVVVVADADVFGWSLCCPRDRFRRTLGRQIALQRAESGKYHINAIRGYLRGKHAGNRCSPRRWICARGSRRMLLTGALNL